MNAMVERVARALEDNSDLLDPTGSEPRDFVAVARAAIAAMREPTEVMIEAVYGGHPENTRIARECWRAMIDAALAD
jgi:hypothetical protein